MLFINTETGETLFQEELKKLHPHISFPTGAYLVEMAKSLGYEEVAPTYEPEGDVVFSLPPVRVEGEWCQQWGTRGYSEQELVELIEQAKAEALARVNEGYIQAVSALEADYPASERESWRVQVDEARRLVEGDTDTPWIDAAAQAREITRDELAQLIITQDGQYRAVHGQLTGRRQALRDQIYALTGSDRETWQALTRLGWSESNE